MGVSINKPPIYGGFIDGKFTSYNSVISHFFLYLILLFKERRITMSENYDPIDSLVSELKRNTGFLDKLLFPKISLLIGTIGVLIAIVLLLK